MRECPACITGWWSHTASQSVGVLQCDSGSVLQNAFQSCLPGLPAASVYGRYQRSLCKGMRVYLKLRLNLETPFGCIGSHWIWSESHWNLIGLPTAGVCLFENWKLLSLGLNQSLTRLCQGWLLFWSQVETLNRHTPLSFGRDDLWINEIAR